MDVRRESNDAIRVEKITKSFGNNVALKEVSLAVGRGTIHALIGLNGSGKSTLVKILSGFHEADSGRITVGGGLAFVHQDLALLPTLTVLENFAIGQTVPTKNLMIDWKSVRRHADSALSGFGLTGILDRQVATLSQAERTIVAIARALSTQSESAEMVGLVLDEPSSALPHHEAALLSKVMKAYAARGLGILFITHRLQEVKDTADRVSVLRNGEIAFTGDVSALSVVGMAHEMLGAASDEQERDTESVDPGDVVLRATSVTDTRINGVSIDVRAREVLGIFGLNGSGVGRIGEILAGRRRPATGQVRLRDAPVQRRSLWRKRIGYIPSDRAHKAIFQTLSVRHNLTVRGMGRLLRRGFISGRSEAAVVDRYVTALAIKLPSQHVEIEALSGGNQQKVILGRWLSIGPDVIVADEPTQGIDVWAKLDVMRELRASAAAGASVVMTTVEPDEIFQFCDRVLVLRNGAISLAAQRSDVTVADIFEAMY